MFCYKCGTELPNKAKFCYKCGNAVVKGNAKIESVSVTGIVEKAYSDEQISFYRKTYLTTGFSLLAWIFTVYFLFTSGIAISLLSVMGSVSWLLVLAIFWIASYIGERLTFSKEIEGQYLGLGIYIVAYAIIFIPLISLVVESSYGSWNYAIDTVFIPAFIATGTVFAALTTIVFVTKTNFSFLKNFVIFGGFFAIGAIIIFSFSESSVGSLFSVAMIILMSITILYETHKIKEKFNTTQHIGAGAMLFASFMVMFWYVIRLFLKRAD